MDCSLQAPLSMRFSIQEYWSGLPFPSPGDLPHRGMELVSLKSALAGGLFTTSAPWENPRAYWPPAYSLWTSLVAQRLKRLPLMQETWVQSRGREDPLEKETATHSDTLAWKIPWMELQSMGSQRVGHD